MFPCVSTLPPFGRISRIFFALILALALGLVWCMGASTGAPQHLLAAPAEAHPSLADGSSRGVEVAQHSRVSSGTTGASNLMLEESEVATLGVSTTVNTMLLARVPLTVTAYDITGSIVTFYTGTVAFTSSDLRATLPTTYTFTQEDQGTHYFPPTLSFRTPGEQWLCVRDVISPSLAVTITFAVSADITIGSNTTWQDETITVGNLVITNSATLQLGSRTVITAQTIAIGPAARMSADARSLEVQAGLAIGAGAGHGGRGGTGPNAAGGDAYGDVFYPLEPGSSARDNLVVHWRTNGGKGGGSIHLIVNDTMSVVGTLSADGTAGDNGWLPGLAPAGGGSGGSIWIEASVLTGTGTIRANGGNGGKRDTSNSTDAGGGGGGRIAMYVNQNHLIQQGTVEVLGGPLRNHPGEDGTVFVDAITPLSSTLIITPHAGITADGISTAHVTVTLVTTAGIPVANEPVSLKLFEGTDISINGQVIQRGSNTAIGNTDAYGVVTATLTSTKAETKTLNAWAGVVRVVPSSSVGFVHGSLDASKGTVSTSAATRTANGVDYATITVQVYDAHMNPIPGVNVTLNAAGEGVILTQPAQPTNASGTTTGQVRATEVGVVTITALADGQLLADDAVVTFVSADLLVNKTGPSTVLAGHLLTYSLTIRNAGGLSASGVILTDTLPMGLTYESDTATFSRQVDGQYITWTWVRYRLTPPAPLCWLRAPMIAFHMVMLSLM